MKKPLLHPRQKDTLLVITFLIGSIVALAMGAKMVNDARAYQMEVIKHFNK